MSEPLFYTLAGASATATIVSAFVTLRYIHARITWKKGMISRTSTGRVVDFKSDSVIEQSSPLAEF